MSENMLLVFLIEFVMQQVKFWIKIVKIHHDSL